MEHSIDDLHFLGSGSAFNPEMDNTSAWFVRGDMFFLLDCGETVFGKIWNLPEFTFATSIAVILTHMHCDHVGSLGTLLSYCKLVLGKQVTVFYPSDNLEPYLRLVGIAPQFYSHVREVPPAWGIAISVHHVEHADDMDCFGYVIQLDDLSFYYSGDAADIPEAVLSQFLDGAIDIMFHDTGTNQSVFHCPLSRLARRIPPEYRGRVISMHVPSKEFVDTILDAGFKVVVV